MKKIYYLLLVLFAASCSQSNEDKIKDAFIDYVKGSFNDPSQFKEIVSIETTDTVSTLHIKEIMLGKYTALNGISNINDSIENMIKKYVDDKSLIPKIRAKDDIVDLFGERVDIAKYKLMLLYQGISLKSAQKDMNEILALKDTLMYEHKVTYRLKETDGLKLKKCYAYSDSLYNKIQFRNTEMKAKEVSNVITRIVEFEEKYDPLFKLIQYEEETLKNLIIRLKCEFGDR